jgi:P27 family predicted phage terminase small subunit
MGKRGPLKTVKIVGKGFARSKLEHADDGLKKLLEPPAGLTTGAKKRWQTLAPLLLDDGRLRADTREALVTYCRLADEADRLGEQLNAEGMVVDTPHGRIPNPLAKILQGARGSLLRFGAVLGLDPTSKARLESSGSLERDDGEGDELAEFFARHG